MLGSFANFFFQKSENFQILVEILLKAVADAPMLKTKKFKIKSDTTIRTLVQNVRKMLKLDANDDQVVNLYY